MISQYLSGVSKAGNDKLMKMAAVLDVNPVWLMGFDVPMDDNVDKTREQLSNGNTLDEKISNEIKSLSDDDKKVILSVINSMKK